MPEPHPRAELDQPGRLGRRGRGGADPQLLSRAPQQGDVAQGLGRRDQHQPTRVRGKRFDTSSKYLLDAGRQRPGAGKPKSAGELCGRHSARQLQQGERIAVGIGQDSIRNPLVQSTRNNGGQEQAGVSDGQSRDDKIGQSIEFGYVAGLTDREHHRDPFCEQPPRYEPQRQRRSSIQPLRVIDQTHQRAHLGRLRQQIQGRQGHHEVVRGAALR